MNIIVGKIIQNKKVLTYIFIRFIIGEAKLYKMYNFAMMKMSE